MLFIFIQGWMKTQVYEGKQQEHTIKCSIIIPARNEAGRIENILSDILQQDYPRELFEIIVINDHSTDDTAKIVHFFQQGNAVMLINVTDDKTGKKAALSEGITLSNGELIVTLDADCRIGKKWLSTIVQFYAEHNSSLIVGPVDFTPKKGFWNSIQNLEFLSLVGISACATNNEQSFLCNGANLIFKRRLFMEIEDPYNKDISSGDDVFFMHKVKKLKNTTIHFIKHPDAIAYTQGVDSITTFLSQRVRWASKSKSINDTDSLVFMAIISLMNILLFILLIFSFFNETMRFVFIACFGTKVIVDFALFKQILPFFKKEKLLRYVPITNFFYFIYFTAMMFLSVLIKPTWKGRRIKI